MSFSFFFTHEESFFEFNSNILETNLINILLLLALLVYAYKTGFSKSLEERQREILQVIETVQEDVKLAAGCYSTIEKSFEDLLLCLAISKNELSQEKKNFLSKNYQKISVLLEDNTTFAENFLENIEKKAFVSLQSSLIVASLSQILRKFFLLSEAEQSRLLQISLTNF